MGLLTAYDSTNGIVSIGTDLPLTLPENGWLRVSNGTQSLYGYYSHYDFKKSSISAVGRSFILGANFSNGGTVLEDATTNANVTSLTGSGHKVFVWSKAGNLRWDNGFQNATDSTRSTSAIVRGSTTEM